MEKLNNADVGNTFRSYSQRKQYSSKSKLIIVAVLLLLVVWTQRPHHGTWFPLDPHSNPNDETIKAFSWNDLSTKPYLDYVDCYGGEFQCARLELPMDYWNDTTNATISLAVIKKPAVVPVTHPRYGGASVHNPGGPGGSGVFFLRGAADALRGVIDSDDGKYFDLLSFDPRGIGESTPVVQCFSDPMVDETWGVRVVEEGVFSASDAALGRLWAMSYARGKSCTLPVADGEIDIKRYVSTSSAARDMLELVERHGEWREKEAKRLLKEQSCHKSSPSSKSTEVPAAFRKH